MRCEYCGQETGLFHECSKTGPDLKEAPPTPLRLAPIHYLKQAIAIARFNDKAILQASRDNNAFLYGVPLWLVANIPVATPAIAAQGFAFPLSVVVLVFALPFVLVAQILIWGIFHLAARFILKGKGTWAGIVRVMLLGSIVSLFTIIPLVGPILAALWGLAILMLAFENVHRIPRMHAFAITLVVGLLVRGVGLL
jgi:hypothetical protein